MHLKSKYAEQGNTVQILNIIEILLQTLIKYVKHIILNNLFNIVIC